MNWIVSQIGAREEYAAARAFAARGELRALFTDLWCPAGRALLARGPKAARAVAAHAHPGVPNRFVRSFNVAGIANRAAQRFRRSGWEQIYEDHVRYGAWYDRRVARRLSRWRMTPGEDVLFAFNTSCLETIQQLRGRGVRTLVDQIDPGRVEQQVVEEERRKWPGWEPTPGRVPDVYFDRLAAEWEAADAVVVNSEWSRAALVRQGVSPEKLRVVPLAYQPPSVEPPRRDYRGRPLVVLWLGSVILRKGIQYLLGAARLLTDRPIRFVVAGRVEISDAAVRSAPPNVEFVGQLTRDQVPAAYIGADVFVLPTLSDGFAITQLEAMAYGLPVVTTPNCGRVVADGANGLIVPAGDAEALAAALAKLDDDRGGLGRMAEAAAARAGEFSLEAYADALSAAADGSQPA